MQDERGETGMFWCPKCGHEEKVTDDDIRQVGWSMGFKQGEISGRKEALKEIIRAILEACGAWEQ
jgi:uncharacterized C2H2 Zn-finger protein